MCGSCPSLGTSIKGTVPAQACCGFRRNHGRHGEPIGRGLRRDRQAGGRGRFAEGNEEGILSAEVQRHDRFLSFDPVRNGSGGAHVGAPDSRRLARHGEAGLDLLGPVAVVVDEIDVAIGQLAMDEHHMRVVLRRRQRRVRPHVDLLQRLVGITAGDNLPGTHAIHVCS